MFRFYLIVVGAIGSAFFAATVASFYLLAVIISLAGCAISLLFLRLDKRVSDLVKLGESVLDQEQIKLEKQLGYEQIRIIQKADHHAHGRFYSYRQIFKAIFCCSFLFFLICAIYASKMFFQ